MKSGIETGILIKGMSLADVENSCGFNAARRCHFGITDLWEPTPCDYVHDLLGQTDTDQAVPDSMASSFASLATDTSSMSNSHERTASPMVMTNSWLDAVHGYSELEADSSAIFSSQHGTVLVECVNWATQDTGRPESPLKYDKAMDVCRQLTSRRPPALCPWHIFLVAMLQDLILLWQSFVSVLTDGPRDALNMCTVAAVVFLCAVVVISIWAGGIPFCKSPELCVQIC